MGNPYITVIIPTYNRSNCLAICLDRLFSQSLAIDSYEVIVVNDGSTDDTAEILAEKKKQYPGLTFYSQKNTGQGNARNLAIKHANGQIVLFIGDDIYAEEDFLKKHADFHLNHPDINFSCLGRIEWFPELKITPFMKWLTKGGPQFAFHKLSNNKEATFWYFYTSNISLKIDLLRKNKFDPDFKAYGWEDIELAYRLTNESNMKIIYSEDILAYHDHYIEEDSLKNKMQSIGRSAHIFQSKHKELKLIPVGFKLFILTIIGSQAICLSLQIISILLPFLKKYYWYAISKRYFIMGIRNV